MLQSNVYQKNLVAFGHKDKTTRTLRLDVYKEILMLWLCLRPDKSVQYTSIRINVWVTWDYIHAHHGKTPYWANQNGAYYHFFAYNKRLVQDCICFFGFFWRLTSLTLKDILTYLNLDLWICTSGTHPAVKESIISSFAKGDSVLRVLIATIAFGMGVSPPNVRYVLHCGPPRDIES